MNTRVFVLLSLIFSNAFVLANPVVKLNTKQRTAFGIETSPVQVVKQSFSKIYPAKVQVPNAQLRVVSAPLDGVVEALFVAEGEKVKAKQVLARVRSQGLLELQANYLETLTRRKLSGESLTRDKNLHKEGIIAKRRLLETQAKHRELVTAEQRDRQTLILAGVPESAIQQLARKQKLHALLDVVSPLSGVVLEQIVTAGQRLMVSDPLYKIGNLSPLWIEIHVPLDALKGIELGSTVRINEGSLTANVITVGRMVHGADQGVLVRAEISTGSKALRPGQFVKARISQNADGQAWRLPAKALLRIDGMDSVFAERDSGFELIPVNIVARDSNKVVVRAALTATDQVVTSGTAALKAGAASGAE